MPLKNGFLKASWSWWAKLFFIFCAQVYGIFDKGVFLELLQDFVKKIIKHTTKSGEKMKKKKQSHSQVSNTLSVLRIHITPHTNKVVFLKVKGETDGRTPVVKVIGPWRQSKPSSQLSAYSVHCTNAKETCQYQSLLLILPHLVLPMCPQNMHIIITVTRYLLPTYALSKLQKHFWFIISYLFVKL